ncbi:FliO/MopB family protein [Curtobacterium herbarum]|uniref:Flagellar biosynthetic protein FliO n=1 Tax=Curtobacterium herbarum TaxID=150122 RepID=A0ABP4K5E7_9MICO|nr:flagellar biosynthetic protein FliO [Curtobacterium herbarum]MBM7475505.1 flagellar biogenesis protein FliO [Curtobacterium herbarum]MCS6543420.1 flagellar biosynthetic protein FliO [Curtobacterium herbarum]
MDTLVIALRVALSLGVVLALMWVLHRRMQKGQFGAGRTRGRRSASLEVVARQGIGGKASVVVVDVDGERLVLGVAEHGVTLLTSGQAPAPELTIVTGPVALPTADAFRAELDRHDGGVTGLPSDAAAATATDVALPLRPRGRRAAPRTTSVVPTAAQLQGSVLSADTWRQAASALRSRRTG